MKVPHIVILGAGISGLSLAWFLEQRFGDQLKITILEKNKHAGGWIQTVEKDDFLFEHGPHSCRVKGSEATQRLIESLELENQIIVSNEKSKNCYLLLKNRLTLLPNSFWSAICSTFIKDFVKAVWKDFRSPASHFEDESIYSFGCRRFGQRFTERLIDPLVTGIYAGDMHKLSVRSCFPKWYNWEKKYGSVFRGMLMCKQEKPSGAIAKQLHGHSSFSFKGGMRTLIKALEQSLQSELIYGSKATAMYLEPKTIVLHTSDAKELIADHVFSTVPAQGLADLTATHNTVLGALLTSIDSASVVAVNLGYKQPVLKKQGFGYLVPQMTGSQVLGAIWDSSVFPEQNRKPHQTRITLLIGGAHHPHASGMHDDEILKLCQESMSAEMGVDKKPDFAHIQRLRHAIPQYHLGHLNKVKHIEDIISSEIPRLTFLGSSFYGVSINDCIAHAERCAMDYKVTHPVQRK